MRQILMFPRSTATHWTRRHLLRAGVLIAALPLGLPAVASDADQAAVDRKRLLETLYRFVQVEYLGQGQVSQTAKPEMYAETVSYFARGDISREQVLSEKRAYYNRWPRRVFDMIEGSLKGQPAGDDEVELFFRYAFDVSNAGDNRKGIATATLRVALEGDRFVIRAEKGGIEKRY